MRRRMLATLAVAAVCTAVMAAPAAAGGWWTYVDVGGSDIGIGETLPVRAEVMFRTVAEAEAAPGRRYFAYLLSDFDRRRLDHALGQADPGRGWWAVPADATKVRVGVVRVRTDDANLAVASGRIRVPRVAVGSWALMLCDRGCRQPLADVIPTSVTVVRDPATARAARNAEKALEISEAAEASLAQDLEDTRSRLQSANRAIGDMRRSHESLSLQTIALSRELERVREQAAAVPWALLGGAFGAGVGVAALAVGLAWLAHHAGERRRREAAEDRWRPEAVQIPPEMSAKPFERPGRR